MEKSMIRFWNKVNKTNSCWLWIASKFHDGYGQFRHEGSMKLAHRISYELHYGPIPDELCVCHICDVPSCVNPEHLFLGTQQENMEDKVKKGRARGGNPRKLTEDQIKEIDAFYKCGY